jgi:hypothetical protein
MPAKYPQTIAKTADQADWYRDNEAVAKSSRTRMASAAGATALCRLFQSEAGYVVRTVIFKPILTIDEWSISAQSKLYCCHEYAWGLAQRRNAKRLHPAKLLPIVNFCRGIPGCDVFARAGTQVPRD